MGRSFLLLGSEAAPKAAPNGKHVRLFKMRCKVGKRFYSIPVNQNSIRTEWYLGCRDENVLCIVVC